MGLRERYLASLARQLGRPDGWRGRLTGRALNRANGSFVAAAVDAAELRPGQAAADVGFGGGIGLRLLLERVGPSGLVYGVDVSTTMVERARAHFAREGAAGILTVEEGSMLAVPLADGCVDAVITVNTVYFVDDLATAFAELGRILRPGGRLVVGIGDPDAMARMAVTAHGFRLRPAGEVLEALSAAGLADVADTLAPGGGFERHLLIGSRPG